jgi:mono/diheme cytochrome c family protein
MARPVPIGVAAILESVRRPDLWSSPARSRARRCAVLRSRPALLLALLAVSALGSACRGMTSTKPPIHVNPNMDHQPKARPQSESDFFYDGASMRPPVPGTVARGELREDPAFFEGKDAAGNDLAHSPVETTPELLARGAERYHIYCQPCHDPRGDGKGVLSQRGGVPTTSMHDPKVLNAADGHIFDVITNGQGLMPAYRWPIPPADRWAIIAHVREMEQQRLAEEAAQ